ncbi:MAG: hypothetical protein QOE55_6934 [Acidobacteriaceae bacterium]|nr:hypothetical protein [Acidobacteriaceae bacterium]
MATKAESTTSGMGDTLNDTAQNVKDKIADAASTATNRGFRCRNTGNRKS